MFKDPQRPYNRLPGLPDFNSTLPEENRTEKDRTKERRAMSKHIQEHGIVIQSCKRCHNAKQVCRALPGFLPGRSRNAKCARCTLSSKPCTATEAIDRIFEQRLLEFSQTQPGPIRDVYLARQRASATAKAREDNKKAAEIEKKQLAAKKLEREQERLEAERIDQRE